MKAAICYEFGQPLVVEEVDLAPPRRDEVKIKVVATAICGSDIHFMTGKWGGKVPFIAGHETGGIVEEVGEGIDHLVPGDHVIATPARFCGHCYYCQIGAQYMCETLFPLDTDSPFTDKNGQSVYMRARVAGFAEYTVVHRTQLIKVAKDLPLDRMGLLACGVITGLGAVVNTAKVEAGSYVVVIGAGGIGINAVQGAALAGAAKVIVVDIVDQKLEIARSFGATHTLNSRKEEDHVQKILDLTDGMGADYVFVGVGYTDVVAEAFGMLRGGGTEVILGLDNLDDKVALPIRSFVEERRVIGSHLGSTKTEIFIPRLIDLYQHGKLKLDELITNRYPLEEINEAIASTKRGEALRNVIVF